MPKRIDIKKVMVIGSGPIVIGQAAEFDYAGTQACLALKEEGYEVVLINSNPATIMTDTKMADKVYMEPLTLEYVARIIRYERPDAIVPGLGGQTGLNLCVQLPSGSAFGVGLVVRSHGDARPENVCNRLHVSTVCCLHKNDLTGMGCDGGHIVWLLAQFHITQTGIKVFKQIGVGFFKKDQRFRICGLCIQNCFIKCMERSSGCGRIRFLTAASAQGHKQKNYQ